MKINRTLALAAITLVVGTIFSISPERANAAELFPQIAQNSESTNQPPNGQRKRPKIDFQAAATRLGVTEAQLKML